MNKTETIGFRIRAEKKKALNEAADFYRQPSGQLVMLLVDSFLEAHKKNKGQLVWPPAFMFVPSNYEASDGAPVPQNMDFIRKLIAEDTNTEQLIETFTHFMVIQSAMEKGGVDKFSGDELNAMYDETFEKLSQMGKGKSNKKATATKKPNKDKE